MTIIVENGSGVAGANSYVDATFVSSYLSDRGREAENGWTTPGEGAEEDEACIDATDYIEIRFRELFLGIKQYRDISVARSTLTLTANPLNTETVVVGSITYQFVTALGTTNDVLIGASTSESIDNLVDAIGANPSTAGTAFEATTVENDDASAQTFYGDTMLAFAKTSGTAGNSVATTTTVTGASWNFATLTGGTDVITPQPLSFPRAALYDRDGILIVGVPDRLKFATAEYAVRARSTTTVLAPDPTAEPLGGTVTRKLEEVGPIVEETVYESGTTNTGSLPAYPAADRLLSEYIRSGRSVIRG